MPTVVSLAGADLRARVSHRLHLRIMAEYAAAVRLQLEMNEHYDRIAALREAEAECSDYTPTWELQCPSPNSRPRSDAASSSTLGCKPSPATASAR